MKKYTWILGIIACELANKYNFPKEVIPQCLEKGPDGFNLIKR